MKSQALRKFRSKLAANEFVYGVWVTLESPSITEMAVSLGLDWVVIDAEHGHLDWKEIVDHLRATVRSDTVTLVRISERNTGLIKRALDIGADGIVVPWVETVEELEEIIADCHFPLEGRRGIGGERATVWGQCLAEHTAEANENVLIVPMIESVAAIEAVPDMCKLEGADIFFFGPADFSSSAGYRGQWEGPGIAEEIVKLKDTINNAGKHCGLMVTGNADLQNRIEDGFQMLGVGSDSGLLLRSLHESLRLVGKDRKPATSLDPKDGQAVQTPLPCPPDHMQPDRKEVITTVGNGESIQLQDGVLCELLVGNFNSARNLTTGIVTFDPEAELDYHTHPCSESITLLEGRIEISVAGRAYRLNPLDNIVIPRWLPHAARNPDPATPARMHCALAMSSPERDPVTREFERREMPADSTGFPGFERVTRIASAERSFGVGPGAEFVDYFNEELIPGIEMSGGYGRFQPGGRLPAHIHDFDESICIIDGSATCLVEGERYSMSNCATAMVPRGRVHYFINNSDTFMDMIWVYAGPMPERILIDEACATREGKTSK